MLIISIKDYLYIATTGPAYVQVKLVQNLPNNMLLCSEWNTTQSGCVWLALNADKFLLSLIAIKLKAFIKHALHCIYMYVINCNLWLETCNIILSSSHYPIKLKLTCQNPMTILILSSSEEEIIIYYACITIYYEQKNFFTTHFIEFSANTTYNRVCKSFMFPMILH